jgi:hypothetical protein
VIEKYSFKAIYKFIALHKKKSGMSEDSDQSQGHNPVQSMASVFAPLRSLRLKEKV